MAADATSQSRLAALAVTPRRTRLGAAGRRRQLRRRPCRGRVRFSKLQRANPKVLIDARRDATRPALDQAALDRDIRRLFGSGDFERVNDRIMEEAGRRALDIDAVEKAWGPNYLRFGPASLPTCKARISSMPR